MKLFYATAAVLLLAACSGGQMQDTPAAPAPAVPVSAPAWQTESASAPATAGTDDAERRKQAYREKEQEIIRRLRQEEYFIGENNLEKIQNHAALKTHAEQLLAALKQGEQASRNLNFDSTLEDKLQLNRAMNELVDSAYQAFGNIADDKAGLYQCANAAEMARLYFSERQQKRPATLDTAKTLYENAVKECREQIKHPPKPESTVYARKGYKIPIKNCLAVLGSADDEYEHYTCPMSVHTR